MAAAKVKSTAGKLPLGNLTTPTRPTTFRSSLLTSYRLILSQQRESLSGIPYDDGRSRTHGFGCFCRAPPRKRQEVGRLGRMVARYRHDKPVYYSTRCIQYCSVHYTVCRVQSKVQCRTQGSKRARVQSQHVARVGRDSICVFRADRVLIPCG
jgi:hypothetical protein